MEEKNEYLEEDNKAMELTAAAAKSLEQQLDEALQKMSNTNRSFAYVAPIVLTTTVPADVTFMTVLLGTEIQSPRKEKMIAELKLDDTGLRLNFEPYLFIDGVLNGKIFYLFLDFETGKVKVKAKGLLGQLKATVERELRKRLKDTLLDQEVTSELFPYHPFKDPDLTGTLRTLQQQIKAKFKSKASKDSEPDKDKKARSWPPLELVELSGGLQFEEDYAYNFGVGQAIVPAQHGLRASIQLQGDLNDLDTVKVPYAGLNSEGVRINLKDKLNIDLQEISYRYGGKLQLDQVEFSNTEMGSQRLEEAVGVVLDELILPIANEKIKAALVRFLEEKVDGFLAGRGINASKALGLINQTV